MKTLKPYNEMLYHAPRTQSATYRMDVHVSNSRHIHLTVSQNTFEVCSSVPFIVSYCLMHTVHKKKEKKCDFRVHLLFVSTRIHCPVEIQKFISLCVRFECSIGSKIQRNILWNIFFVCFD